MSLDVAHYFNQIAPAYHQQATMDGYVFTLCESYFQVASQYLQAVRLLDKTALDVCIGSGIASRRFLKDGYTVYGIDAAPTLLQIAVKNGFDERTLIEADVTAGPLPFEDNSFAVTLSAQSLLYLKEAVQVVAEMIRVTRTGGLILIDPSLHKLKRKDTLETVIDRAYADQPHWYLQSADAFEAACKRGCAKIKILNSEKAIAETLSSPTEIIPYRKQVLALIKS